VREIFVVAARGVGVAVLGEGNVTLEVAVEEGEASVKVWVAVTVDEIAEVGKAGEVFVTTGVGVACATLAALSERDDRITIPKMINLLTD
jgi:hypothetical protein